MSQADRQPQRDPQPQVDDRRVRRTRAALQAALRDLIIEKRYETITVTEILRRADVGRSTFYAHFTDKDALLLSAAEHVGDQLDAALPTDGSLALLPLFEHAGQHAELYRALSRGPGGRLFLDALREHLALRIQPADHSDRALEADVRARYEASAIIGTLIWWLDHDQTPPAAHIARLVEALRPQPE